MELNWTTFVLEIINFLVLMWILKRFLYRPVLAALNKRREAIEQTLNETEEEHARATALEKEYQNRLKEWNQEKQKLREKMLEEVQAERTKKLTQLQGEVDSEQQKATSIRELHEAETLRSYQRLANKQGAKFAAKLLSAAAGKEVESNLFDLFMQKIVALNEEQTATLNHACEVASGQMNVISAYALDAGQCQKLEVQLNKICGKSVTVHYQQDPGLLAGLRINVGGWALGLNLKDELTGFAEIINESTND